MCLERLAPHLRPVVLGTAIRRADNEAFAQFVTKRLNPIERGFVDEQLARAAASDLGR